MGNRKNRACRRKKPRKNQILNFIGKSRDKKIRILDPTNNNVAGEDTVVDVVSFLCPSFDIKLEPNDALDPIATATESGIENRGSAFRSSSNERSANKFPYVASMTREMLGSGLSQMLNNELEIESNENLTNDKHNLIEFENICRLCLTKEENTWIEVFSNQPYENSDEITPSNILEIIEQFTTVKISKHDRLPDKLCGKCFEDLRYMYNFRAKSLRSTKSLNLTMNALSETLSKQNQQKKVLIKFVHLKPIERLPLKEANNRDEDRDIFGEVQCEICGKVFEKYKLLQYHLNIHNGVKPFVCTEPDCEKSFYSPQNRKTHINNVHSIDPKFKCDLCEKTYNIETKLKIHRTSHFPPTIPCKICGKLLRSQASVRKHRASHTERVFKCDDCGKSFQTSYTLRVHQRIHTNEKPFICCKCGQAFAHNCLLKAHTEKYHPS